MVTKWRHILSDSRDSVEMFDHVSLMTLDSLLKCIFGYSGPCVQTQVEGNSYISSVHEMSVLASKRFRFPPYYSDFIYYLSPSGRRFKKACDIVHAYSSGVIKKRKEQKEKQIFPENSEKVSKKCKDFLDMLLDARVGIF